MTSEELEAIADAFNDLFKLLRDADPRDKVELCSRMGLGPTCQPANARPARSPPQQRCPRFMLDAIGGRV
jgi:hypothetical protein